MPAVKVAAPNKINGHELAAFRDRLMVERDTLFTLYRHDIEVGQSSTDEGSDDLVDRANNSYNRELMFSLSVAERDTVYQIDEALRRIEAGKFGTCGHCGDRIIRARLEAVPWARYCVRCQERDERGLLDG